MLASRKNEELRDERGGRMVRGGPAVCSHEWQGTGRNLDQGCVKGERTVNVKAEQFLRMFTAMIICWRLM